MSSSWLAGGTTIPSPLWALGTVPSHSSGRFFTWLQAVFGYIHADQFSAEHPQDSSSMLHSSPLCSAHASGSLCGDLEPLWWTVAQAGSFPGLIPNPSSCAVAWKLRQFKGYFQVFPVSQGLESHTACCPGPENQFPIFILFIVFGDFRWKVSLSQLLDLGQN